MPRGVIWPVAIVVGVGQPVFAHFMTAPLVKFVQYTSVPSNTTRAGYPWLDATTTGAVHVGSEQAITCPPFTFVQYTRFDSTAIPLGPFWADATTVGALLQPLTAHAVTVLSVLLVQ